MLLVRVLREPATAAGLDAAGWTALLAMARAEQLIGSLACRLEGIAVPDGVAAILADARASATEGTRAALWEAEMARRALAPLGIPVVLLKGTAFAAAGLDASVGRSIGDLDILVPRDGLDAAEAALKAAGWEWVKEDAYDDAYYRRWMHELPPLIHRTRDRMIDVHHTILPPTARWTPDAAALISGSVEVGGGLRVLSPADMIVHAACHLLADGDLAGGLRNLWDIDRLIREVGERKGFADELAARAELHEMAGPVRLALRLAGAVWGTPVDSFHAGDAQGVFSIWERLIIRRITARDGWGRGTRAGTRLGFFVRSHWLRMPPAMLARHLWIKATKSTR